ncbi:zinc finger protein 250-like [Vanessa atalanta]|uniref:zinc finger protein 250-like n=1 Tax=Vanessa atalanta TaxID=42275 RepID=UPI001FCDACC9|nr:zinc finger protein 250-like [Vanessa atalanta]
MDDICRLCCSPHFVNNYIFDEENALFLKMSLYLPIKVFKNDRLPQKICDKCSCKVNDFYQFCNETIEVQNRLKGILTSSKIIVNDRLDFTIIKQNANSPPPPHTCTQGTQTEHQQDGTSEPKIKTEPKTLSPEIKKECDYFEIDDFAHIDIHSDNSEEEFLIDIKKKKKSRKENNDTSNGVIKAKRGRKRKTKQSDQELGSQSIANGLALISEESGVDLDLVKEEIEMRPQELGKVLDSMQELKPESNEDVFYCCMCFAQCGSRLALLKHYKEHGRKCEASQEPAPPPAPPGDASRCLRCQKTVAAPQWAEHWRRHFARDTHPFRCALCEVTYRDHHRILKHGLTHGAHELRREEGSRAAPRFVCDVCPAGFRYMRCLLAHRTRAHPEAAGRALALRCGVCARSFAHSNSLRRHARVHSGELNYLCNVCGKALSSREHLKFHIRIHTGYKPNVCKVCGKGFVKKCNLKLHERVHSGEKPHVCSHCGKAFSQRSTLVIHERYHSGARPYACSLCGRGFVARGLLTMHLKTACVDAPRHRPPPPPRPHKLSSR